MEGGHSHGPILEKIQNMTRITREAWTQVKSARTPELLSRSTPLDLRLFVSSGLYMFALIPPLSRVAEADRFPGEAVFAFSTALAAA